MKKNILLYAICWCVTRYSNFAKDWDIGTVSIGAMGMMFVGLLLFDFGKTLLRSGKHGILYIIVMTVGGITFVADEFYHVGWYLDFQNQIANTTFGLVSFGVVGFFTLKLWRMILTREEE